MVRSLRRPPVKGTADPDLPGHILVPVRAKAHGMPKVNYTVPDTSYWRVNKRTQKPVAVVTMTPDGVKLGWDQCGSCAQGLVNCTCQSGISLPHAIGYIFISRGGQKPLPLPHAVRFQQPEAPAAPKHRLQPVKKRRTLNPIKQQKADREATKEAEVQVRRALRKLKRNG